MTDEEIESNNAKMVHYFSGVTAALSVVIQALQAQPGYDHRKFLDYLATYQVVGERTGTEAPVRDSAYQDTLSLFAKTPPQFESVARKIGRGPASD